MNYVYDGFKRDLERSLQVLRTDHIDLYQLHDLRPREWTNLRAIESGALGRPTSVAEVLAEELRDYQRSIDEGMGLV